jgi:hypothetical protein
MEPSAKNGAKTFPQGGTGRKMVEARRDSRVPARKK